MSKCPTIGTDADGRSGGRGSSEGPEAAGFTLPPEVWETQGTLRGLVWAEHEV